MVQVPVISSFEIDCIEQTPDIYSYELTIDSEFDQDLVQLSEDGQTIVIEATYNLELVKERVKVYLNAYDSRGYQAQFKLIIVYDESDESQNDVSVQE